jgi:hypothetical protein
MDSKITNVLPKLRKKDLTDDSLFKLNLALNILASQLAATQGNSGQSIFGAGPFSFSGAVTVAGNVDITGNTTLRGNSDVFKNFHPVNIPNISVFADNAAARAAKLVPGDLYVTPTGQLMRVY